MKNLTRFCILFIALTVSLSSVVRADEVTDWNQIMLEAIHTANLSPLIATRAAAIVQSAVYDAVNGIERRYTPIRVQPSAVPGASRSAAVVQSAYAALIKLFPAQQSVLDVKRSASLAAISSTASEGNSESITRGIAWGQYVADEISAWRSTDGFTPPPPPFLGGNAVGQWRPTPPAFAPGAGPQFAYMTPWVIASSSQFLPSGPPALGSAQYLEDFNEVKLMGSFSSPSRTTDQTLYALFWNASSPSYFWNRAAVSVSADHHLTLSENARLLGLLNVAIADAAISCWNAKYTYVFWRPVTAIPLADTDGNPGTIADPNWTPLFATPAFPEYPSGHSCNSSAAATVLANYFGDNTAFILDSDVMLEVTRFFPSFSAAIEEVANARVFAGIHFRTACRDGVQLGSSVANYVLNHSFEPVHEGAPQRN
jgi:membrane-associated phospholipid phosphatase